MFLGFLTFIYILAFRRKKRCYDVYVDLARNAYRRSFALGSWAYSLSRWHGERYKLSYQLEKRCNFLASLVVTRVGRRPLSVKRKSTYGGNSFPFLSFKQYIISDFKLLVLLSFVCVVVVSTPDCLHHFFVPTVTRAFVVEDVRSSTCFRCC